MAKNPNIEKLRIVARGKKLIRPMLVGVDANNKEHYIKWLSLDEYEELIWNPDKEHEFGMIIEDRFETKGVMI